jgi:hypothetical protein
MVDGKILEALNVPLDTEIEVRIINTMCFILVYLFLSFYLSARANHAHDGMVTRTFCAGEISHARQSTPLYLMRKSGYEFLDCMKRQHSWKRCPHA